MARGIDIFNSNALWILVFFLSARLFRLVENWKLYGSGYISSKITLSEWDGWEGCLILFISNALTESVEKKIHVD